MHHRSGRSIAAAVLLVLGLDGCSYLPFFHNQTGPNYQNARLAKPLEVPPDLLATVPQPGVTVPAGPVGLMGPVQRTGGSGAPAASSSSASAPAFSGTSALPQEQGRIVGKAGRMELDTPAPATEVWSAVRKVLAAKKVAVRSFSAAEGTLVTGWQETRSGIDSFFGSTVAPDHRMQYTFHLKQGASGTILSVQQKRFWNNPNGSTLEWTPVSPDAGRNHRLLEAVLKRLSRSGVQTAAAAPGPVIRVVRYRDSQGPYLVVDQVPARAAPAVQSALARMGYPVHLQGQGAWSLQVRGKGSRQGHSGSMIGNMFSRAWDSINSIWSSPEKPVAVDVRLLPMANGRGSVLETLPAPGDGENGQKYAVQILDRLQAAIGARNGAGS